MFSRIFCEVMSQCFKRNWLRWSLSNPYKTTQKWAIKQPFNWGWDWRQELSKFLPKWNECNKWECHKRFWHKVNEIQKRVNLDIWIESERAEKKYPWAVRTVEKVVRCVVNPGIMYSKWRFLRRKQLTFRWISQIHLILLF